MDERLTEALTAHLRTGADLDRWWTLPEVQAAYRTLAAEFMDGLTEPADKGEGRGIVTCGGGVRFYPSLHVLLASLKRVGCTLPVEVWHLGGGEMDPHMRRLLEEEGATVREAGPMRKRAGWQLKLHAVAHSAFQEALFIDADNAPISDPSVLFGVKDYADHGALFWPDYIHWVKHPNAGGGGDMVGHVYHAFGLPLPARTEPEGPDYEWYGKPAAALAARGYDLTFESGQFVIDRSRRWRELALSEWYAERSELYFKLVQGDNECLHFAWRVLGSQYGMAPKMPDYDTHTILQFDWAGKPMWEHRNRRDMKWGLGMVDPPAGAGLPAYVSRGGKLTNEGLGFKVMARLAKRWSGLPWYCPEPDGPARELAAALAGRRYLYHRVGLDARLVELLPGFSVGNGKAENELYWSAWVIDGTPAVSIGGVHGPTCVLSRNGDGGYHGRWLIGERCEVELRPSGKPETAGVAR